MTEKGLKADPAALTGYSNAATGISDEVGKVGTGTLNGLAAVPADAFGRIDSEVGVAAAFQQAAKATIDGIAAVSGAVGGLGKAVSTALTDYQRQDADNKAAMNRAANR